MKKAIILFILIQFIVLLRAGEDDTRLLRVQEPVDGLKQNYHLFVNIEDIMQILKDPALDLSSGETQIRLYNTDGSKLAKLGLYKNNRVKWLFKCWRKKMLCVKMDPVEARNLLIEAAKKKKRTGYQLGLTQVQKNSERLKILKCYCLVFHPHVDLYGVLVYPLQAAPGQDIGNTVSIKIYNEGSVAATQFFVDLILTKKSNIPVTPGIPSKGFREGMLLGNGRMRVDSLAPGATVTLQFKGPMIIPKDTPPGKYNLAALLDPDHKIHENQEDNNCISRLIFISNEPIKSLSRTNNQPIDLRSTKKKKGEGNV